MPRPVTIVWFRDDHRLADNDALGFAARRGVVVPVFIMNSEEEGEWPTGAAACWWLFHSLASLGSSLAEVGSRLIVKRGPSPRVLVDLAEEVGADTVVWQQRFDPPGIYAESKVASALNDANLRAVTFTDRVLFDPRDVRNKSGGPFQVFTPFWKHLHTLADPGKHVPAPEALVAPARWPDSVRLEALNLLPTPDWASGMRQAWKPGEAGGQQQLRRFLDDAVFGYQDNRDFPSEPATSKLSPFLRFGNLSPKRVWHEVRRAEQRTGRDGSAYRRQIAWREFAYHLLFHFPQTTRQPLRPEFERFPWDQTQRDNLAAWQHGKTGYPIVDAGMRELWHTGWMHNRVRMVAGSLLVKHLLINWQEGATWFWDTLVDADLANNTMGWQWVAGSGADAAPYFRVFNPILQGERFDRAGDYVRRWVPELSALPDKYIHQPWKAPRDVLLSADVHLGKTYPKPVIDHTRGRNRALAAYDQLKASQA